MGERLDGWDRFMGFELEDLGQADILGTRNKEATRSKRSDRTLRTGLLALLRTEQRSFVVASRCGGHGVDIGGGHVWTPDTRRYAPTVAVLIV